jgi:hypothetical protein
MKLMLTISAYDGDEMGNESYGYGAMNSYNGPTYVGGFYYGEYHGPGKLVIDSKEYISHYKKYS